MLELVLENPSELQWDNPFFHFLTEQNTLDGDKLYHCFMYNMFKVLENYEVPPDCPLSEKHLKLVKTFKPCEKCADLSTFPPRFVRCDCEFSEKNPTLGSSKLGAVLNLEWIEVIPKDGKLADFKMDVDVVCGMIPVMTKPNGIYTGREKYLRTFKHYGRNII